MQSQYVVPLNNGNYEALLVALSLARRTRNFGGLSYCSTASQCLGHDNIERLIDEVILRWVDLNRYPVRLLANSASSINGLRFGVALFLSRFERQSRARVGRPAGMMLLPSALKRRELCLRGWELGREMAGGATQGGGSVGGEPRRAFVWRGSKCRELMTAIMQKRQRATE